MLVEAILDYPENLVSIVVDVDFSSRSLVFALHISLVPSFHIHSDPHSISSVG